MQVILLYFMTGCSTCSWVFLRLVGNSLLPHGAPCIFSWCHYSHAEEKDYFSFSWIKQEHHLCLWTKMTLDFSFLCLIKTSSICSQTLIEHDLFFQIKCLWTVLGCFPCFCVLISKSEPSLFARWSLKSMNHTAQCKISQENYSFSISFSDVSVFFQASLSEVSSDN